MKNYRYVIVSWPPAKKLIEESVQDSNKTILRSNDGTKCLLKFKNINPLKRFSEYNIIKMVKEENLQEELKEGWDKPMKPKKWWEFWRK